MQDEEKRPRDTYFGDNSLETYRRNAIAAAVDLKYGFPVVKEIQNAKTHGEIQRIMINARHKKFGID